MLYSIIFIWFDVINKKTMTTKTKLQPQDIAFNKLFFYNTVSGKRRYKYGSVQEAEAVETDLKKIVEKLTPEELEFLTDRISSI